MYRGTTMGFMHACVYPLVALSAYLCVSLCGPGWGSGSSVYKSQR